MLRQVNASSQKQLPSSWDKKWDLTNEVMKEDHIIITAIHKNTAESWSNSTAYSCKKNKDIIPIVENSTSITTFVCSGFFFFLCT